jgi:hypothetical protein
MNRTPGITAADDGGSFDPREAAALLDQAAARAHRAFTPGTPALFVFRAALVLVVFGGFWLSVRGQRPYSGPTGAALPVAFALVAVNVGWTAWAIRRAGAGVSGPHQRARLTLISAMVVVLVAAYAFTGPLFPGGSSYPVWGLYQANVPMLIVGAVGAIVAAGRDRPAAGTFLFVVVVAVAAGFGGPAGAWLVMGIGLCAACLVAAGAAASQRRRGVVRP